MTIHTNGIEHSEREKIDELKNVLGKKLLEDTPLFNDDFSLLRWLIGWDYNLEEILPRYKKVSNMMKCLKLNDLPEIDDIDEINTYTMNILPCCKYFPGGLMGFDSEGNGIFMQTIGLVCPKELFKCGKASDLFYLSLVMVVLVYKKIKKNERLLNKRLSVTMIMDLEGWNMDLLYMPCVKLYMMLTRLIQDVFPELGKSLLIINAPSMISMIYKIFKPAFAEATIKKISLVPRDYKQRLISEIGAEYLFEKWGGTKIPSNGLSHGSINLGGMPPESLRYDPSKNPYHIETNQLTKIYVYARQKTEIPIRIETPGSILRWFFWTNGEIDFCVIFGEEEFWPKFRLSTEFVPEFNSITCEHRGTYTLVFDNTLSTFFSREIKYKINVE